MNDLSDMINEQKECFKKKDKYMFQCASKVLEKYIRKNKFIKNFIYPWCNYDWNYVNYVDNFYDPKKLGASSKGDVTTLVRDIDLLIKIIQALISDPNPSSKSAAKDVNKENDLVPCSVPKSKVLELGKIKNQIDDIKEKLKIKPGDGKLQSELVKLVGQTQQFISSCGVLNSISFSERSQKEPYKDKFFKPLTGEKSSSFYAMIGSCPTKIDNQNECEKKGYNWISNSLFKKPGNQKGVNTKAGSCFKGKYAYIDNSPGLSIGQMKSMKGLIPSLIKNISEFSPDKLAFAAAGYGIPGLEIQQCDTFKDYKRETNDDFVFWIIIFIVVIYFFLNL